jgi:hypothetical protein
VGERVGHPHISLSKLQTEIYAFYLSKFKHQLHVMVKELANNAANTSQKYQMPSTYETGS